MGALRSVPAPAPSRPATGSQPALRAKSLGKLRLPERQMAREFGAVAFEAAAANASNAELGRNIGGEHAGAQARTGALVLTLGEVALLMPVDVAFAAVAEALRERIVRESVDAEASDEDRVRYRMALMHLDSLGALLRRS